MQLRQKGERQCCDQFAECTEAQEQIQWLVAH